MHKFSYETEQNFYFNFFLYVYVTLGVHFLMFLDGANKCLTRLSGSVKVKFFWTNFDIKGKIKINV